MARKIFEWNVSSASDCCQNTRGSQSAREKAGSAPVVLRRKMQGGRGAEGMAASSVGCVHAGQVEPRARKASRVECFSRGFVVFSLLPPVLLFWWACSAVFAEMSVLHYALASELPEPVCVCVYVGSAQVCGCMCAPCPLLWLPSLAPRPTLSHPLLPLSLFHLSLSSWLPFPITTTTNRSHLHRAHCRGHVVL
jgi:hypothetical protein